MPVAESLNLPSGQRLIFGEDVAEWLRCGVLAAEKVVVEPSSEALKAEIESQGQKLRRLYGDRRPGDIPALQDARRLYRSVGVDPTRMRPSSEALLRRVLKGQSLYLISNAVDVCNLSSLSFLLPIGLYDLAKIDGDVTLRLGLPGEEYPGIRKSVVHLEGRLGLFDTRGPFGSPTSDSARTCVTSATCSLLAVIMASSSYPAAGMSQHVQLMADLLQRHCSAFIAQEGLLGWEEPTC
jgi:DNA/RNA-binding domain of Phe-tRNA-synthetase-like protein